MPALSIITVNLNNAKGLQKTIESVVSQTFRDFEFIIIDGGSTDGCLDIINQYAQHFDYWVSEPDSGVYNAMNKGITKATGKYCHFLNSGDYYTSSDVLEKIFGSGQSIDAPFITGHQINDFGDHRTLSPAPNKNLTLIDFFKSTLKHQATFIKRDLFDQYGLYDENLRIVSDWKFFVETIIFQNMQPAYVDVDIVVFEWFGLSTNEAQQHKLHQEKLDTIQKLLPKPIFKDYEYMTEMNNYDYVVDLMKRNRYFSFIIRSLVKLFK
ncbi:glycosyltransferase [Dysgonomonas sp. 216]|uniref:glycosyltransferase family 2 protein n=1 Tax=Dysgonomonas sp. 216 TaxID=2302934 RepID=UPI0013D02686|nr:glycosyltransferase family 2 protein [Dysgonomonas sp. 216]NDW17712.1 glycosyltransferase [Dysgonomonas sp. 216]